MEILQTKVEIAIFILVFNVIKLTLRSDPYIFSLATNPFYLWLICTIFTEVGEAFVPRTLTQLYTWVILVFGNRHGIDLNFYHKTIIRYDLTTIFLM